MRTARALVGIVVVALAVAGVAILPMSSAAAQQSNVSGATAPSWQTNDVVYALAAANNVVYVGGAFTQVRPPGAASGTSQTARGRLAAFNATTGALITTWDHPVNGTIRSLALSPDKGTLYVGGDFSTVDGVARNRAAALSLTGNGTLTSWNPSPDARVNAITATATQVYLGGSFGRIGTAGRRWIAAVSTTTGALRTSFAPVLDNVVYALDMNAAGDRLYAGGAFSSVGGDTTWHSAVALSPTDASVQPFSAVSAIPSPSASCYSHIRTIKHDADSMYFGAEGTGGGCFDGTFAAKADGSLKWKSGCLGATQGIEVVGGQLFAGSHAHDCTSDQSFDPDAFPETGWSRGLSRHLTNRSTADGRIGAWQAQTDGGTGGALGPRVMATDGSQLFVGGEFTTVNGARQQGFARFAAVSGSAPARPAAPRAVVRPGGKVSVFVQTPLDLDDTDLVVRYYRDNQATPFATKTVHSLFWRTPIPGVEDNGLAIGSQHTYSVDVTEVNGSNVSTRSPASNQITVASSAGAYSDAVNADSPTLFWRLGEPTNSTIAADSGGNLNPGEVKGTTAFNQAGQVGGDTAANFDGLTSNVVTQNPVDGPTSYSVEAWFKTTTTNGGKIIGFGNNRTGLNFGGTTTQSSSYDRNVYMSNNGMLTFGTYSNGFNTVTSPTGYNDGQWHHVVGTQSPSTGTAIYVDGVRLASNGNGGSQSYRGYWRVGGDNLGSWPNRPSRYFFNGTIDDVAVYPSALSAERVDGHYRASGRSGPDTFAPAVAVTSPSNGDEIAVGANTVTVQATDAVGVASVEVFVDGSSIGTDSTAPFEVDWTATAGQHTIVAEASDAAGNVGTSGEVVVTATAPTPDTTDPTVSITSPTEGEEVYGPVTIEADAADNRDVESVTFKADGITVSTDTTAPYEAAWNAIAQGTHTLEATAVDAAGNSATDTITVTVPADTTAPSNPAGLAASAVTRTSVGLSWNASTDNRGTVTGYRVVQNGTVLPGTVSGTSTTVNDLAPSTSYTFTVRAVDPAGNVSGDSNSVSVTTSANTAVLFTDDWGRADAAGWGANWATTNSNGSAAVSSGTGLLSYNDVAGAYSRAQLTGVAAKADTEVLLSFNWNQTTALSYLSIYTKGSGGWQNGYRPRNGVGLQLSSTSAAVEVQRNANGVLTQLRRDTGVASVTTAKQWVRLRVSGTTLQYKIWTDGQTEPAAFRPTVNGADVASAGQLFIATSRSGSNSGAKSVTFDDLSITDLNP